MGGGGQALRGASPRARCAAQWRRENAARRHLGIGRLARLRVLLVDGVGERASLVSAGLRDAGFEVVAVLSEPGDLTRRVRDSGADVIVCDLDDPGR